MAATEDRARFDRENAMHKRGEYRGGGTATSSGALAVIQAANEVVGQALEINEDLTKFIRVNSTNN
jgi:hypothetical protein